MRRRKKPQPVYDILSFDLSPYLLFPSHLQEAEADADLHEREAICEAEGSPPEPARWILRIPVHHEEEAKETGIAGPPAVTSPLCR